MAKAPGQDTTVERSGFLGRFFRRDGGPGRAAATPKAKAEAAWHDLLAALRADGLTVSPNTPPVARLSAPPSSDAGDAASGGGEDPLTVAAVVAAQHALIVLSPVWIDEPLSAAPRSGPWTAGTGRDSRDVPNPMDGLDRVMAALKIRVGGVPVQGLVVALGAASPSEPPSVPLPGRVLLPDATRDMLHDMGGAGGALPSVAAAFAGLAGSSEAPTQEAETLPAPEPPPKDDAAMEDVEPEGANPATVADAAGDATVTQEAETLPAPEPPPERIPEPEQPPEQPPGPQPEPDTEPTNAAAASGATPPAFRRADALRLPDEISAPF